MLQRLVPLDEKHAGFVKKLQKTIDRVSPPDIVQQLDTQKEFDRKLHSALADSGVLAVGVPDEMGGAGGDTHEQLLALELLARKATSTGVYMVVHYLISGLLRDYATQAQQDAYLSPLIKGKKFGAFCLSEAGGGTDILTSMETKAVRKGDNWVISGSRMWISGATFSDFMIILARTGEHRSRGITMFIVPSDSQQISSKRVDTVAINGYETCEVSFDRLVVPASAVLGEVNLGFMQVLTALNSERLNAAAAVNGMARGALEAGVAYSRQRHAFGRPIGQFQAIQHRLAAVGIETEGAWALIQAAARGHVAGEPVEVLSSMAKYASSKAAVRATDVGMELMGAAGFDLRQPMQRFYRGCRLHVFAPLNNDMVLNFVGERWLDLPRCY